MNIGLFCSTPAVALGRAVPHKIAMEMLFTGKPISAEGKAGVHKQLFAVGGLTFIMIQHFNYLILKKNTFLEALQYGLINKIVPEEDLEEEVNINIDNFIANQVC